MANILLLGGTGFIGTTLLPKLLSTEHTITILSRSQHESNQENLKYIQGNILDKSSLKEAVAIADYIIQAVQFPGHPVERPWLGEDHTYEGLDAVGTENVCSILKEIGHKPKQYIYVSGAGVDNQETKATDYPWTKAKKRAEKAIKSLSIPYTILRPSWVYGRGDQSMSKFVLFAKYLPFFPVIGDGSAPVNPLWVEDLAQIIFNCINNPESINQTISLGSLPEINMKEVATEVLNYVGVTKPILCHPKPLMKFAGVFAQFIPISPLSPNSVEFLTMDVHLNDLQEEILGVKVHSLKEGLQKSGL